MHYVEELDTKKYTQVCRCAPLAGPASSITIFLTGDVIHQYKLAMSLSQNATTGPQRIVPLGIKHYIGKSIFN